MLPFVLSSGVIVGRYLPPLRPCGTFPLGHDPSARISKVKLTQVGPALVPGRLAWPTNSHRLSSTARHWCVESVPPTLLFSKRLTLLQKSAHLIENKHSQIHCPQPIAHSLSLFSCKSFICRSYAKHTGRIPPSPTARPKASPQGSTLWPNVAIWALHDKGIAARPSRVVKMGSWDVVTCAFSRFWRALA
jgi:hypothetical protein